MLNQINRKVLGSDVINFSEEMPLDHFLEINEEDFKELSGTFTILHHATAMTQTRVYRDSIMGLLFAVVVKEDKKYIRVVDAVDLNYLNIRNIGYYGQDGLNFYEVVEEENLFPGLNSVSAQRVKDAVKLAKKILLMNTTANINVRLEITAHSPEEVRALFHVLPATGLSGWHISTLPFWNRMYKILVILV